MSAPDKKDQYRKFSSTESVLPQTRHMNMHFASIRIQHVFCKETSHND